MRRRIDPWGPDRFRQFVREQGGVNPDPRPQHWSEVGHQHDVRHMPVPGPESPKTLKGDGWWVFPLVWLLIIGLVASGFALVGGKETFYFWTFIFILFGVVWGAFVVGRIWLHFVASQETKERRAREGYRFFPRYRSGYYWGAPFAIWGLIALLVWIF